MNQSKFIKDFILEMNTIISELFLNDKSVKFISVVDAHSTINSSEITFFVSIIGELTEKEFAKKIEIEKKNMRLIFGQKFRHKLRKIPVLNFVLDKHIKKGFEIEALLDKAIKEVSN